MRELAERGQAVANTRAGLVGCGLFGVLVQKLTYAQIALARTQCRLWSDWAI